MSGVCVHVSLFWKQSVGVCFRGHSMWLSVSTSTVGPSLSCVFSCTARSSATCSAYIQLQFDPNPVLCHVQNEKWDCLCVFGSCVSWLWSVYWLWHVQYISINLLCCVLLNWEMSPVSLSWLISFYAESWDCIFRSRLFFLQSRAPPPTSDLHGNVLDVRLKLFLCQLRPL